MDDSSSEDHFMGKMPERPATTPNPVATQPAAQKPYQDSDDGFNEDDQQDPFKQNEQAEKKQQQAQPVAPTTKNYEMKKSKKHKRLKQRRFKEEESNSYRNSEQSEEDEPQVKPRKKKEIKKSEAPRKRQPARPKEESKRDIERRQMEESCKGVAEKLIEQLDKRSEADRVLYEQKKPALEKLKYLNQMATRLENKIVQHFFLELDGLQALEKWLRKYPDGEEPCYTIRKRVLQVIFTLPARSRHISKAQQLATIIQKYKKSTNSINRQLKTISQKIVFKWQNICNFDERERLA